MLIPKLNRLNFAFAVAMTALAASAFAGAPTEGVKTTTDKVVAILNNPKYQGPANKKERRNLIRKEIDIRFNWPETARGCLGRHWPQLTPAQQQDFIKLFREFLENTYLDRYDDYYVNLDKIEYKSEKIMADHASVTMVVVTKSKIEHPVEYRLEVMPGSSEWRVYDTVIEGVSAVKNYRDQFDSILSKSSYEALAKDLKSRLAAE